MKLSYACDELIHEAEFDLKEEGNIEVYAMFEKVEGVLFLTNYDFIEPEMPLTKKEREKYDLITKANLNDVIYVLKLENNVFGEYEKIHEAFVKKLGVDPGMFDSE